MQNNLVINMYALQIGLQVCGLYIFGILRIKQIQ